MAGVDSVLLPSLKVQWQGVATRLLSEHLSNELVPFLQVLSVDINNNVDLHPVPSSWTVHLLRDPLKALTGPTERQHVAFSCLDFMMDLRAWHEKLLAKQEVDLAKRLAVKEKWDELHKNVSSLLQEDDKLSMVNEFTDSLLKGFMGDAAADADAYRKQLAEQVQVAMVSTSYTDAAFDKSTWENISRLAPAMNKDTDLGLGEKLLNIGEAGQHVLSLCKACVMYTENKKKIMLSSKPDRATTATLQALNVTQSVTLGYFRKTKTFDVACLLLDGFAEADAIEKFASDLVDLTKYPELCYKELQDVMYKSLNPLMEQLSSLLGSLPAFDIGWTQSDSASAVSGLDVYQKKVTEAKIADLSAQLLKKADACAHCCKVAGMPHDLAVEPWQVQ